MTVLPTTRHRAMIRERAVLPLLVGRHPNIRKETLFALVASSTGAPQMAKAIQKEGLTPERFMEINQSQRQLRSESVNSSEDLEKFRKIVVKFQEIMDDAEEKRQSTVATQGLELERFLEIEKIVSGNRQLQAKVERMLGN